jgi:glycosyltransferase involved in cell wall biosynthesis
MISVVIPVFNGAAYIGEAIESVLGQSLPPAEIIVVDDGSSDGTAEVVRRYQPGVLYRRQAHEGAGAARNLGIRESKGDWLAFLDADDVWLPDKLRLQKAAFEEDPGLDLVFSHMNQFRTPELPAEVVAGMACDETSQPSPLISCLLARHAAFDSVGPLRTEVQADFVDWYLRAREAGLRMRVLDVLLVRRRIHPGNFTREHKEVRHEYLHLLKASLDRRRAKPTGDAAVSGVRLGDGH